MLLLANFSATHGSTQSGMTKPISILPRLGDLHHPVSTTNQMAQRFFDQGITFIFAAY